ncbi:MAG: Tyrosine recombinase XerD [Pelotomaculum sp. PtaB.Bin104]|nr:MAG: Tyrosine recombinase XerD [Pelotomaculum sp. PtaB.Bin104]
MILNLLIKQFLQQLEINNYSRSTIVNYGRMLQKFADYLGNRKLEVIKLIDIYGFQVWLKDEVKTYEGELSQRTMALYLSALKSFFKFCQRNGVECPNPAWIDLPKIHRPMPVYLNRDEISALISVIPPHEIRDRLIVNMLYTTGLRVSELVNIQAQNIDLPSKKAVIRGKGGRVRTIFFTDEVCNLLRLNNVYKGYIFKGRTRGRVHLTTTQVQNIVRAYGKLAGINKTVTPHVLRHSLATTLLQNGANLRIVQELMGHSQIGTTEVYTHISQPDLQEAHLKYLTV